MASTKEQNVASIMAEFGADTPQTRAIAEGLANNGISSVKDIGVRQALQYTVSEYNGQTYYETRPEYFNKKTNQIINPENIGMIPKGSAGVSGGDLFFDISTDERGNVTFNPRFSERSRGFFGGSSNVLAVAAFALNIVAPGVGSSIGYSILGAGDAIAGAALAGEIAAATGISTITAASVGAAVGSASISAGVTAAKGGSVEDVIKSGLSAGAAVGVNFAAGGGITGAAAGSAAGTAIQGGNLSQIATNAFGAAIGAGVQDAMPSNPDAGKILGTAARTYITTGGNLDKTLLNTATTALGTLDKPTSGEKTTTDTQDPTAVTEPTAPAAVDTATTDADVMKQVSAEQAPTVDQTGTGVVAETPEGTNLPTVTVRAPKQIISETATDVPKVTTPDVGTKEEPSKVKTPPEKIYPTVTSVPPPSPLPATVSSTITGASPSRLLADALSAYRPPGAVEGVESGKEREPVWNTESLRNALGI